MALSQVQALVFDVFGTVVDWRTSVIAEAEALGRAQGVKADWAAFADEWRVDGYLGGMAKIRNGEAPWAIVDDLHRRKLVELLDKYGVHGLAETKVDDFNRVWHRLGPWPDSVAGLTRLKRKFIISSLSNGNVSLLTNMAKNAGLPWDCVIGCDLFKAYKPMPAAYQGTARLLNLRPEQVMLVAAHHDDLEAAQAQGFRTAFVARPTEYGPGRGPDTPLAGAGNDRFDFAATDFLDLAGQLGA